MAVLSNLRLTPTRKTEVSVTAGIPLEALPFPASLLDGDAVFEACNREWLATYPEAAPGTSCLKWCETVHGSARDPRAALLAGIKDTLAGTNERFTQDHRAGGAHFRILVAPAPGGALIVLHDLDGPAAQPTVEEDPELTRQSHKMEALGRLAGGVAHDFANLLTLIAGYGDILRRRVGENSPLGSDLGEILKAAKRGSRLTAQLLNYARRQAVQPRALDLNLLIEDLQRMLRPILGEYLELRTLLSPGLSRVVADSGQMEQVVMNLILNARDAMPVGGSIHIATANGVLDAASASGHGLPPGACVTVTVQDTGPGIEPRIANRIFEPFFTTKPKGTGLGLSTVHSIVKQCGGDVWVRSEPGDGAAFTVCLPAAPVTESQEYTAAAQLAHAGSETVLLVEDEEGVRRLLAHILRKQGYEVLEASNGEEALGVFHQCGEIQLVLTDMVMPKMNGRVLVERILQATPSMKVIYMSGYTDDVLERTGPAAPGIPFLQKPLRPEVLTAKVRETLDSPSLPFDPQ